MRSTNDDERLLEYVRVDGNTTYTAYIGANSQCIHAKKSDTVEGNTRQIQYFHVDGSLNSLNDKPAIEVYENGEIVLQQWYRFNMLHRDNNRPAQIQYKNGAVISREWYIRGTKVERPTITIENIRQSLAEIEARVENLYADLLDFTKISK